MRDDVSTPNRPSSASPPPFGYVARATLVVIALLTIAAGLWKGREVLFLVFLSVLFGAFLGVFVDRLERFRVPRIIGAPLVLLTLIGIFVGIGAIAWPTLETQFAVLAEELPRAIETAASWVQERYARITGQVGEARNLEADVEDNLGGITQRLARGVVPFLSTAGGALTGFLLIIFTGLYLCIEQRLFRRGALRLVPPPGRQRVSDTFDRVANSLRGWIVGTTINMVVVGVATGVALWALGIPAAIALGVIAGILEFIPVVGPIIAAIPALALALIVSPTTAVWVLLLYVVIQQLESNLLGPLVMKGVVKLPPALSIVFQLAMSVLFGFVGLLVAVPLLAAVVVAVKSLYVEPMEANAGEVVTPDATE